MKQISNKEYAKYQQYQNDKLHGRILTPDGLRIICAGLCNDPEKIGIHMLEMLAKFRSEGLFDITVLDDVWYNRPCLNNFPFTEELNGNKIHRTAG